jgi:hypothetical protein
MKSGRMGRAAYGPAGASLRGRVAVPTTWLTTFVLVSEAALASFFVLRSAWGKFQRSATSRVAG